MSTEPEPQVSPTTGTPTTPVTFQVTYKNSWWLAPDYVQVTVGGKTMRMSRFSGDSWKHGVVFQVTGAVPAGFWTPQERSRSCLPGRSALSSLRAGPACPPRPRLRRGTPEPDWFKPLVEENGVIGWKLLQTLARELRQVEGLLGSR